MNDCLFCKIIAGEIPSEKIYENEHVYAFLDINPVNPGHTLVIPKRHAANLYETPDEDLAQAISAVKRLSVAVKRALAADGINIEMNNDPVAGQVIFHTHFHVIPRFEGDGRELWKGKACEEKQWKETAEKIRAVL